MTSSLAHISDLHLGRGAASDASSHALVDALVEARIDTVLLTGDVTHGGRHAQLATFERVFSPLADRLVLVPGNHDRMGDDAARALMPGARVQVAERPGLFLVRLDSTTAHNRYPLHGHGALTWEDIAAIERAVASAPRGALVALMLHHHLLPLPEDGLGERIVSLLGSPNADELALGRALLGRLRGRCDLVLHGHRHAAGEVVLGAGGERPLRVVNAGCTPRLGRARVLRHAQGRILAESWLELRPVRPPERAIPATPEPALVPARVRA